MIIERRAWAAFLGRWIAGARNRRWECSIGKGLVGFIGVFCQVSFGEYGLPARALAEGLIESLLPFCSWVLICWILVRLKWKETAVEVRKSCVRSRWPPASYVILGDGSVRPFCCGRIHCTVVVGIKASESLANSIMRSTTVRIAALNQ